MFGYFQSKVDDLWRGVSLTLQKSPQELIDLFASVVPGPPVTQRNVFGYPAGFVNGNMFMGLFEDEMILRLPEDLRQKNGKRSRSDDF
jgi:hypothetical protein